MSQSGPRGARVSGGAGVAGGGVSAVSLAGRGVVASFGDLTHPVVGTGAATRSELRSHLLVTSKHLCLCSQPPVGCGGSHGSPSPGVSPLPASPQPRRGRWRARVRSFSLASRFSCRAKPDYHLFLCSAKYTVCSANTYSSCVSPAVMQLFVWKYVFLKRTSERDSVVQNFVMLTCISLLQNLDIVQKTLKGKLTFQLKLQM